MNKINIPPDYIISDNYKPCCVCGKLTNRIEINYEAYICSPECERVLNSQSLESD